MNAVQTILALMHKLSLFTLLGLQQISAKENKWHTYICSLENASPAAFFLTFFSTFFPRNSLQILFCE